MNNNTLAAFIDEHRLPKSYLKKAKKWFVPMVSQLVLDQEHAAHPLIIGINGAQGSGKTTLAALMVSLFAQHGLKAVSLSIDDFYYTRAERFQLADKVHPLLRSRGVPGTHDIALAVDVLKMLQYQQNDVAIPRFDKAHDDRFPEFKWDKVSAVDVVIIEGWCLGAFAQAGADLHKPVNVLEREQDRTREWRTYANQQLALYYPALFNLVDRWVMLKAPNFDCVFKWRQQQEVSLRQKQSKIGSAHQLMDDEQLGVFIQHYQRITEQMLIDLPARVDYLFELDQHRNIKRAVLQS
jgi:D-glycerate 3-kinase